VSRTQIGVAVILAGSMIALWSLASLSPQPSPPPAWLSHVGHLPLIIPQNLSYEHGLAILEYEITQLENRYPSLRMVILPESAWNSTDLSHANFIPSLALHQTSDLLIGSFSLHGQNHLNNSIFWFHKGQFAGRFDKCHAIPCVERVPYGAGWLCHQLFFSKSLPICPSKESRPFIAINNFPLLLPCICSELFCLNQIPNNIVNTLFLLCVMTGGLLVPYFACLMTLVARLRALEWKHPILYISFRHTHYFDQHGNVYPIATTTTK
jgi:apolipoprotein N-acyltransferase